MSDSNPKPLAKGTQSGTTPEQPVEAEKSQAAIALEAVFARGSGHINDAPATPERRTEHSVMEGLPAAKAERVASIYRDLAELQRQLSTAQQRIATEIQGRAEDAERYEAIEARQQEQELKAQRDAARVGELEAELAGVKSQLASASATAAMAEELRREVATRDAQIEEARKQHREATDRLESETTSLRDAKTQLEARDAELATRTSERDSEQATRSRLERELEEARKQHGESLATRETELAAVTSERDTLKGELEKSRGELETGRTKARELASQLVKFGQELDGAGIALPPVERPQRPQPPPVPTARAAAHTDSPPKVETILEVTEVPRAASRLRAGLLLLVGVILGCGVTIAIAKASNPSTATAANQENLGASSPSAFADPVAAQPDPQPALEPAAGAAAPVETTAAPTAAPTAALAQPTPKDEPAPQPSAAAAISTEGVLLLPEATSRHRLFVDGKVVPVKKSRAVVPCGTRAIQIGSRGTARTFDVACGGETTIPAETDDR